METPESYKELLQQYFTRLTGDFDALFKECIIYEYPSEVKYVDLVVYPEHFMDEFSVAVWPTLFDRSVDGEAFTAFFSERLSAKLDEDLNPYNIDYEWREDIFWDCIRKLFSDSWTHNGGCSYPMKYYLLALDDEKSWSVNKKCMISEYSK